MSQMALRRWIGRTRPALLAGLVLLGAIGALAVAYGWIQRTPASLPAGPLERVTIATNTPYVGTCPVLAARENGYFSAEGIQAVVQPHSSGKAAMEAVLKGQADLGTVADIPVMFAGLSDDPVTVIATIFKTERDHGVVGRRDRGVLTPASLKGKRIGVTLNTSGHFALDALLNRQKLASTEVSMLNFPPEQLFNALAHGDVDAVATWEPTLGALGTLLGSNGASFYAQDIYESLYNIAGMRRYVLAQPETVKKVLRALIRGAHFCADSPDAARTMFAASVKGDPLALKGAWPSYRFSVVLEQGLVLALEDEARWAIKNKLSTRAVIPNYLDYIYLDGLQSVAPAAVTIIH